MMLDKNIRILKARFPEVYKRILEVGSREPLHFRYGDGNSAKELLSVNGKHTFPTFADGKKDELIELWFCGLRLQSEAIYSPDWLWGRKSCPLFFKEFKWWKLCTGCGKGPSITKGYIFENGLL